jgi:hypothetical protein
MRRHRSSAALLALTLAACTNQASTEPGDPPADAGTPSALGHGLHIVDMNTPEAGFAPGDGAAAMTQMNVGVTGAVFLVQDEYAETGKASSVGAVYAEDFHPPDAAGAPYSGIELYKSVFEPASLTLGAGDVIDFTGEYQRYFCSSEGTCYYEPQMYEPVVTFRFDYSPPAPTLVPISDFASGAAASLGNQWMFMLVVVENLEGGSWLPGSDPGECMVFLTTDTSMGAPAMDNELFDLPCGSSTYNPDAGYVHFKSVTGIVSNDGNWRISPRSPADIVIGD